MKIEAGKYYKTAAGKRFYCASTNRPGPYPIVGWLDNTDRVFFSADGTNMWTSLNLISEWVEPIPWDTLFPDWVKWFSVDEDGTQCGFENKPELCQYYWICTGSGYIVLPDHLRIPYTGNWRESLQERPEK